MKKDNKKALYESIMTSVAKEVKKTLNEEDVFLENEDEDWPPNNEYWNYMRNIRGTFIDVNGVPLKIGQTIIIATYGGGILSLKKAKIVDLKDGPMPESIPEEKLMRRYIKLQYIPLNPIQISGIKHQTIYTQPGLFAINERVMVIDE